MGEGSGETVVTATEIQQQNITETFLEAERSGLRVAIRVRIVAFRVGVKSFILYYPMLRSLHGTISPH